MNLRIFPDRDALLTGIGDGMIRVVSGALAPAIGWAGPLAREAMLAFARATGQQTLEDAIRKTPDDEVLTVALEQRGDVSGWSVSRGETALEDLGVSTIDLLVVDARCEGRPSLVSLAADRATSRWIVADGLVDDDAATGVIARWSALERPAIGDPDSTWWFIDVTSREVLS